ncbi:MAG: hypothetical protein WBC92_09085 [Terracidiphilus sp.]
MGLRHTSRIGAIFIIAALMTTTVKAWPHRHAKKSQARFLATSTLIRGTWGENEDTYLAQLVLPEQNEAVLVRLVDTYPNEAPPLSYSTLTSDSGTLLRVKRDRECDRPFGEILLRAAPGDLIAILPERLDYRPPLEYTPGNATIVPCYRTVR